MYHRPVGDYRGSDSLCAIAVVAAAYRVEWIDYYGHIKKCAHARVDYPPKFGRRLCEKIRRICSQIPPKFDPLTFAHTAFAYFTTYLSVVHYNKPLGLFMCKHLSDRVAHL